MKVLFIAAGWDRDIIIKSIYKSGADRVYLVVPEKTSINTDVSSKTMLVAEQIRNELAQFAKVEFLEASYLDFGKGFAAVSKAVKDAMNNGAEIEVNITEGNKIVTVALLMAAFLHRVRAVYSLPESYNPEFFNMQRPWRQGVKQLIEIPLLPVNAMLSEPERRFLIWVASSGGDGVKGYLKTFEFANENRGRASYHYNLKKLEGLGLLVVKDDGGRKLARLTESGKIVMEFFRNGA